MNFTSLKTFPRGIYHIAFANKFTECKNLGAKNQIKTQVIYALKKIEEKMAFLLSLFI